MMASFRHEGNRETRFMPLMRSPDKILAAHQCHTTVPGHILARMCSASWRSSLDPTAALCQAHSSVETVCSQSGDLNRQDLSNIL